jgi:hypothetical protein
VRTAKITIAIDELIWIKRGYAWAGAVSTYIGRRSSEQRCRTASGDYGVAEYRAYTVDGDGHFIGFEPLVCATDAEAIEQAKRLLVSRVIELWSGERMVIRLDAKTK